MSLRGLQMWCSPLSMKGEQCQLLIDLQTQDQCFSTLLLQCDRGIRVFAGVQSNVTCLEMLRHGKKAQK